MSDNPGDCPADNNCLGGVGLWAGLRICGMVVRALLALLRHVPVMCKSNVSGRICQKAE